MSELQPTPEPTAEPSFADYVRVTNAAEARGEAQADAAPLAADPPPADAGPALDAAPEAEPEPTAVDPAADRNADGTFKKRSAKSDASAEDVPRIRELTAKRREAERERDALQARIRELEAGKPTDPKPAAPVSLDPSDPKPKLAQFLDAADPYEALADAHAEWAVREAERRYEAKQQAFAQQTKQRELQTKLDTFADAHPDYQDKIDGIADVIFPHEVLTAIREDDEAPAIAYYLGSHPEEARRIAALRPLAGVKALGQILTRLTAAPSGPAVQAAPTSRAKPLIKPVSGAPVAPEPSPPDPDTTPFHQWVPLMNEKDRKAQREARGA